MLTAFGCPKMTTPRKRLICCGFFVLLIGSTFGARCYVCSNPSGECAAGQCDGPWCVEQIVRNAREGRFIVSKGCAQSNPLPSKQEDCLRVAGDGTESINCVCNSQDFCNSQEYLSQKFPQSFISLGGPLALPTPIFPSASGGASFTGLAPPSPAIASPGFVPPGQTPGFLPQGAPFPTQIAPQQQELANLQFLSALATSAAASAFPTPGQFLQPAPNWASNATTSPGATTSNFIHAPALTETVPCYQCTGQNKDCTHGRCRGSWCVTTVSKSDAGFNVIKDCSPENPLGKNKDDCTLSKLGDHSNIVCTCRSPAQICNEKEHLELLFGHVQPGGVLFKGASTPLPFFSTQPINSTVESQLHKSNTSRNRKLRCYCSPDAHGRATCQNDSCYGEACVTFNGTQFDSNTRTASPLAFYTCETDSLRNELQQDLANNRVPVCEPSNYLENTSRGSVQISGQSCYCVSEICNHPQLSATTTPTRRYTPSVDIPESNIHAKYEGHGATSPSFSREFNVGTAMRPNTASQERIQILLLSLSIFSLLASL